MSFFKRNLCVCDESFSGRGRQALGEGRQAGGSPCEERTTGWRVSLEGKERRAGGQPGAERAIGFAGWRAVWGGKDDFGGWSGAEGST